MRSRLRRPCRPNWQAHWVESWSPRASTSSASGTQGGCVGLQRAVTCRCGVSWC